jgi:hypothetical protein
MNWMFYAAAGAPALAAADVRHAAAGHPLQGFAKEWTAWLYPVGEQTSSV